MEEPKVDLAETFHLPLPRDLIQNILSRLPIDSLFQSKLVCTSWRSLINRPDRVLHRMHHTHLAENPKNPKNQPTSLIILDGKYHTSTNCCLWYLHDLSSTHTKKAIEGQDLPFESSLSTGLSVVGSCNGFLCLTDALDLIRADPYPNVVISNPVNGDWLQLPPSDSPSKPRLLFFGFGYNLKKKEYKVLRMQDGEITGHLTADVLTLGRECDISWRRLGTITPRDIFWDHFFGIYANGCLHWFTVGGEKFGKIASIKTFDLDEETFGTLGLPQSLKGKSRADFFLGEFGGSLMIVDHSESTVQKVWFMEDCLSWTLKFIIPTPPRQPKHISPSRPCHICSKRPLFMLENGNVLLQYGVSLFSYNPITKEHELVRVDELPFAYTTTPHVGTLVTLGDICSMKEGPSSLKMGRFCGDKMPTSSLSTEESCLDAASEKELGNQYFREKKFKEAIGCYTRSIVLSPTAVAFANRAMAYLKIQRFGKAENDCTEALNLNDGYIKAYSRRATAREKLGKLKECLEDLDFALKLEPDNLELKNQYSEAKASYDEEQSSDSNGGANDNDGGRDVGRRARSQMISEMACTQVDMYMMHETPGLLKAMFQ